MHCFRRSAKTVSIFLTLFLSLIHMPVHSVFAAMIETEALLGSHEAQIAREKVRSFLERRDVRAVITAQGIDPLEAQARVESLSDAEVKEIVAKIDRLPVGGSFLGTMAVIGVIFFLVLLILDLLGVVDVFTFIHPSRK
jgi:hypothetical protein